jgi:hypothetical protein
VVDATKVPLAGVTYQIDGTAYITGSVPQSLSLLEIFVRTGDSETNLLWYGTASIATNGLFTALVQFPVWTVTAKYGRTREMGIELTLFDATNGVTMTYSAQKKYIVSLPMGGTNSGTIYVSTNLINVLPEVPSVFARTGPISAASGDYTADQVGAVPTNSPTFLATVTNGSAPSFPSIRFTGLTNWTASIGAINGSNGMRFVSDSGAVTNWNFFQ